MVLTEITNKTKAVVREWAHVPSTMAILLDDQLGPLRLNAQDELRHAINAAFTGSHGIPISQAEWAQAAPKTVRGVRDLVNKEINGG